MNPVVDNGCPTSVTGLDSAAALADSLNIPLELSPISKPFIHYFGPATNSTEGKWTVAQWLLPLRFRDGFIAKIPIACVTGDDPLLLGGSFLDLCTLNNPANELVFKDKEGKEHFCKTYKREDGHRYLELAPREHGQQQYVLYQRNYTTLQERRKLVELVHRRTHASPASIRMLLQRNGIWHPSLKAYVEELCRKCSICIRTGEPLPSRKVSISHIECNFNSTVGVDFFYWQRSTIRTVVCIHAMCLGTKLSEAEPIESRDMNGAARKLESLWIHHHGRPVAIGFDPEFNKAPFLAMLNRNGIIPEPRPARRHNKLGRVERKHRTIKQILSRLAMQYPEESDLWLVKFAVFLSNIFSGNQVASAFELARGYTPSLTGSRLLKLPHNILQAHRNLVAVRALNRILCTKAVTTIAASVLKPGTPIYGYVKMQKGHGVWRPYSVIRCDGAKVEVRASQRGPKTLLALEDVRLRPENSIARDLGEGELTIPTQHEGQEESQAVEIIPSLNPLDQDFGSEEEKDEPRPPSDGDREADQPSGNIQGDEHEAITRRNLETDETDNMYPTLPSSRQTCQASELEPAKQVEAPPQSSTPQEPQKAEQSDITEHTALRRSRRSHKVPLRYRDMLAATQVPDSLSGLTLDSDEQTVLATLYEKYGADQFTKNKAPEIPEWLYFKALDAELDNWKGHYEHTKLCDIPPGANVVGSHVVYRIKKDEQEAFKFKARLVVHGNEDLQKDDIRKDAATAHLTAIRLVLSMAACYGFNLGQIDIKAAYFQSGPIRRRIYVRPPRELLLFRTIWKLLSLPYGIVEAGRQWQLASDDFLHTIGLSPVYSLPQCFMLKRKGKLELLVGKIVDDFLVAGKEKALKWFSTKINARFTVGKETYTPQPLRFNGAIIQRDSRGSIRVCMHEFAAQIQKMKLDPTRRKQTESPVTGVELQAYQSLAGKMNWLGHSVVPHYAFAASYLQQQLGDLRVKHLATANGVLREAQKFPATLVFGRLQNIPAVTLCTFADAAFPKIAGSLYGQTGIISGLVLGEGSAAAFHPLSWSSHKQSRVARSSSAAEILAIVEAEEFGATLCIALEKISGRRVPHQLIVDSKSLFDTITTQHESKDFRLRQAVRSLRERYELGEISTLRWIAGKANPADALTKRGASTSPLLSNMCLTGRLCVDLASGLASKDMEPHSHSPA